MRRIIIFACMIVIFSWCHVASAQDGEDQFPLIWVSATDMLYAGGPSGSGYSDVFHLAYKYSTDWVLVVADNAVFSDGTITYINGKQYTFDAEGKHLGEMNFTEFLESIDYASMENAPLGDDGGILTPFTGPEIGFAVARADGGYLDQIALARDAEEYKGNLHLYDGFLYQFDEEMVLETQIAFSEISFSTTGLLRSSVEAIPYEGPTGGMPYSAQPAIVPFGTPATPGTVTGESSTLLGEPDEPEIILPTEYDVPAIKTIGVVMFNQHSDRPDLIIPSTEKLTEALGDIENLEVKQMEYDNDVWGGGLMYERVVELGEEYGVDVFIISDLTEFDVPDDIEMDAFVTDVRVACEIDFAIIDCIGGKIFWRTTADKAFYINYNEYVKNEKSVSISVIRDAIGEGIGQLIDDEVLAGGPIGKDWKDEN